MTSEVIVMNKSGIALASDSAATIMPNGKTFHAQNKIFPLSYQNPLGIMIHERLRLNGVPWETIIKSYAHEHGHTLFDHTEEQLHHFLQYIEDHPFLFSHEGPAFFWLCDILTYLENLGYDIKNLWHHHQLSGNTYNTLNQFAVEYLTEQINRLKTRPISQGFASSKKQSTIKKALGSLDITAMEQSFNIFALSGTHLNLIKDLIYHLTIKDCFSFGYSRIILAGFGKTEFLPTVASAKIGGLYLGHMKYRIEDVQKISNHNQSQIIPYAATDMVSTFIKGVHPHYEDYSLSIYKNTLETLIHQHVKTDDKDALIERYFEDYKKRMSKHITTQHIKPVVEGIRFLPKMALATVAESLVNFTSFKTSMLPGDNFVGGDTDVALISKGDGFHWVKHKYGAQQKQHSDQYSESSDPANNIHQL